MKNKVQIVWYPFCSSVGTRTSGYSIFSLSQANQMHDFESPRPSYGSASVSMVPTCTYPHLESSEIVGQSSHSNFVIF